MDYAALKLADAALPGAPLPLGKAVQALNAQTLTVTGDVTWAAIRDVLMGSLEWGTLVQTANTPVGSALPGNGNQTALIQAAALAIRECCLYGGTFRALDATTWGKLTTALGRLSPVPVGAISAASVTAIVALRTQVTPVWPERVDAGNIQTARSQPDVVV